tara:strand:+ start:1877 stop:2242 length:366 start_codon:yes stop_codon:yes gene_type:complete
MRNNMKKSLQLKPFKLRLMLFKRRMPMLLEQQLKPLKLKLKPPPPPREQPKTKLKLKQPLSLFKRVFNKLLMISKRNKPKRMQEKLKKKNSLERKKKRKDSKESDFLMKPWLKRQKSLLRR